MKHRNLMLVPIIALLGSSLCSAAVYNLSYRANATPTMTSSFQGVIGVPGESWNQAQGTFTDILDATGIGSTIDVTGLSGGETSGPANSIFSQNSNMFVKGANQTIAISGLSFGGVYDIYIYSLSHFGPSLGNLLSTERGAGAFTTTNITGNGASQPLDNGNAGTSATTYTAGSNYVVFQSIVASGTGEISIVADALDGVNATRLHVNGLQIVSIPETSSAALLGLGVFGLIVRRRR